MDSSPGEEHLAFVQWSLSKGIKINGVAPARFPGRRLGMIATKTIEKNEIMINVPLSAMLTVDSIPSSFVARFPAGTPNHGILAAFLTHGDADAVKDLDAWRAVWPNWQEFEDSMPILWDRHLRQSNSSTDEHSASGPSVLPPSVAGLWNSFEKKPIGVDYDTRYQDLLLQQEARLKESWEHVVAALPEMEWKAFVHNWLVVNSRSFYYLSPGVDEPEDWNDAVGMVPFADYFNHEDDTACDIHFDRKNYIFKASRKFKKGEEIFMSYGAHSNDFLLVEYGFYLDTNPSDSIFLDDIIFQDLTIPEKTELARQELFGNYEITAEGPSTKVQAAASLKYMTRGNWRNYIHGQSDRGVDVRKTMTIIRRWIEIYIAECEKTMGIIDGMASKTSKDHERNRLGMVLGRWKQIKRLCEKALESLDEDR